MNKWIKGNGTGAKMGELIEVEVEHVNKKLSLHNQILEGSFGDDGFYLSDGGELNFMWDIVAWRRKEQP